MKSASSLLLAVSTQNAHLLTPLHHTQESPAFQIGREKRK